MIVTLQVLAVSALSLAAAGSTTDARGLPPTTGKNVKYACSWNRHYTRIRKVFVGRDGLPNGTTSTSSSSTTAEQLTLHAAVSSRWRHTL